MLLSAIYTVPAIVIRAQDPAYFQIPFVPYSVLVVVGVVLLAIGIPFFFAALVQVIRGFPKGKLFTGGTYAMCRHPVYGCWVVFNVPGIVLLMSSWLGLLVPVLMYGTLRLLVGREEQKHTSNRSSGRSIGGTAAGLDALFRRLERLKARCSQVSPDNHVGRTEMVFARLVQ